LPDSLRLPHREQDGVGFLAVHADTDFQVLARPPSRINKKTNELEAGSAWSRAGEQDRADLAVDDKLKAVAHRSGRVERSHESVERGRVDWSQAGREDFHAVACLNSLQGINEGAAALQGECVVDVILDIAEQAGAVRTTSKVVETGSSPGERTVREAGPGGMSEGRNASMKSGATEMRAGCGFPW